MIAICNGAEVAFLLSDAADISQWPLVIDGAERFTNGLHFEPTIVRNMTTALPVKYLSCVDGAIVQDQARHDADVAAATAKLKADTEAAFSQAIQQRLDAFARTRNYDGILSACTYATSTVAKFKAEGQYCVDARDATWNTCYGILAQVESGAIPMPTLAEVIAQLPTLTWPA